MRTALTIKRFLTIGGSFVLLFAAWSAVLYYRAPVNALRGVVTYHPPNVEFTREAGLGVMGRLTLREMPIELITATIAAEDRGFMFHHGIRFDKIKWNLRNYFSGKDPRLKGGSTITQQIAKNVFVGADRSFYRKYREAIYAAKLERYFNKTELFEIYVNLVQVAPGLYGYNEGAKYYFEKRVGELAPAESAFLADILSAPEELGRWVHEHDYRLGDSAGIRLLLPGALALKTELARFAHVNDSNKEEIFEGLKRCTSSRRPRSPGMRRIVRQAERQASAFVRRYGRAPSAQRGGASTPALGRDHR